MFRHFLLAGLLLSPSTTLAQQHPLTIVAQIQATSALVVDNSRPTQCSFFENRELKDNCDTFRMLKTTSPNPNSSNLAVGFYFDDGILPPTTVMYVVFESTREVVKRNGKTFYSYPVFSRRVKVGSTAGELEKKDVGRCLIAPDNSEIVCGDPEYNYVYRR